MRECPEARTRRARRTGILATFRAVTETTLSIIRHADV
jgi:hypothetical protein